ncbi:MAG: hypothetical protein WAN14_11165, partial [Candidatus Acidiferrales bacterium]
AAGIAPWLNSIRREIPRLGLFLRQGTRDDKRFRFFGKMWRNTSPGMPARLEPVELPLHEPLLS